MAAGITAAANGPRTRFGRSHYKYSSSLTIPYKNSPFSSITYEGTSTTHAYISIQRTLTPAHVPNRPKNVFGLHRLLTKYRGRQVDSVICYEWYGTGGGVAYQTLRSIAAGEELLVDAAYVMSLRPFTGQWSIADTHPAPTMTHHIGP